MQIVTRPPCSVIACKIIFPTQIKGVIPTRNIRDRLHYARMIMVIWPKPDYWQLTDRTSTQIKIKLTTSVTLIYAQLGTEIIHQNKYTPFVGYSSNS